MNTRELKVPTGFSEILHTSYTLRLIGSHQDVDYAVQDVRPAVPQHLNSDPFLPNILLFLVPFYHS